MGILLNSAYAVDFLNSDIDQEDAPLEASKVHPNRFSVLVHTAMELMEPQAQEAESQDQLTAQTTN